MNRIIIACIFLICAALAHAEVYRWKDEQGNLHFSDSPPQSHEFETVEISPVLSVPAFKAPQEAHDQPQEKKADSKPYQRFSIAHPVHDSAIRSNAGDVSVNIDLKPPLRGNHSITLFVDGDQTAESRQSTFQLNNVDRGTHRLHAEIKNSAGKTLMATDPIEFTVLRVSILNQPAAPQ